MSLKKRTTINKNFFIIGLFVLFLIGILLFINTSVFQQYTLNSRAAGIYIIPTPTPTGFHVFLSMGEFPNKSVFNNLLDTNKSVNLVTSSNYQICVILTGKYSNPQYNFYIDRQKVSDRDCSEYSFEPGKHEIKVIVHQGNIGEAGLNNLAYDTKIVTVKDDSDIDLKNKPILVNFQIDPYDNKGLYSGLIFNGSGDKVMIGKKTPYKICIVHSNNVNIVDSLQSFSLSAPASSSERSVDRINNNCWKIVYKIPKTYKIIGSYSPKISGVTQNIKFPYTYFQVVVK